MASDPPDDLAPALRRLPRPELPELARERIRRRARALFVWRSTHAGQRWLRLLDRWYGRAEPVLAVGVTLVYLAWAAGVVAGLQR